MPYLMKRLLLAAYSQPFTGGRRQGRRQETGGRRQEAGGRRREAGGGRQEAGGRSQEAIHTRQFQDEILLSAQKALSSVEKRLAFSNQTNVVFVGMHSRLEMV